jgi:tetratricopeptide (TPR) repeat protein
MSSIAERMREAQQQHHVGHLAEAETLYRSVLAEAPRHAHALHLLGVLTHQLGRHEEARTLIEQALAVQGPHPVFYSNLAAVCLALGQLDEAEAHCQSALRLKPDLADARRNLQAVLRRKGQPPDAEPVDELQQLTEAVERYPHSPQLQYRLAVALLARGQVDAAIEHLRQAIHLKPDFANAHSNLGAALGALNRLDESVECFQTALRLEPTDTHARSSLAATLSFQGRTAEAMDELRETLRIDPNHVRALGVLSTLAAAGNYRFTPQEVERITALADRAGLPPADRSHYHFALAQWLDQAGNYELAFEHARQANELRQELNRTGGEPFDPAVHRAYVDDLIATFSPEYFGSLRGRGVDSELPVFIVGMMRSGTTLAEQILASHPLVHGAGELADLGQLAGGLPRRLGTEMPYPQCVAAINVVTAQGVAADYLRILHERGGPAQRVVDKMPLNFLGLGLIATLFPRARIIHCRRDPVDTCLSCYFRDFTTSFTFKYDLHHLGIYYREYERLMAHWRRVLPVPMFELQYEELTAEPEVVSRRLVAFCGLEWDERCLRFHETERPVRTASTAQVRQPMYRSAVGRWKRYEKHLGRLLAALGLPLGE